MASDTEARASGENASSESPSPEDSYGRIVTSSSLIGGSQVVGLVLALFRAKLAAVLIGADGVGLNALLQGIMTLGSTLCSLGLQQSGARQVAAAYADDNRRLLSQTVHLIRRLAWWTGGLGLALAVCFATAISEFNFGTAEHRWEIVLLGVAILVGNLTTSESAALQGTRRIVQLAKVGIWSGILGTLLTLACYWWLGLNGVAPAIVAVAVVTWGFTRAASRSVAIEPASLTWNETKTQTSQLLQLGLALAANAIVVSGVAYLTRYLVNEYHGLDGVGLFSAAFALSGMFVGFVLSAMSADFYPALTARANDSRGTAELINQQTQVALLLAFPGLLGTLFLAPIGLTLFYSAEFAAAEGMLRWFIVGCFARVLSWPLGYCLLARGNGKLFLLVETCFNVLHLGLIWLGLALFDLTAVAIAFAAVNFLYVFGMLIVTKRLIGFKWSASVRKQLTWMFPLGLVGFLSHSLSNSLLTALIGCLITGVVGLGCLGQITSLVGPNHRIRRLMKRLPSLHKMGLANPGAVKQLRVFHGLVNYGTQAGTLARALRALGCDAISVTNPDSFERFTDVRLLSGGHFLQKIGRHLWNHYFKVRCFFRYDIFHFYYGTSLLPWQWDLPLYRLFGKRVVLEYLGNDIQGYETSIRRYRWTNVNFMMSPAEGKAADERIRKRRLYETRYADRTLVCAPVYSEFAPESSVLPIAVDLDDLPEIPYPEFNGVFKLLHAPTDRNFKGTKFIIDAIEQLKVKGFEVELTIVEKVSHAELLKKYGECHLFIDQILGGWYGTASIEAMACGRPVVCSVRQCYFEHVDFGSELPIIDADPDTVTAVLENLFQQGIDCLKQRGSRCRVFAQEYHDSKKVAAQLLNIYRTLPQAIQGD